MISKNDASMAARIESANNFSELFTNKDYLSTVTVIWNYAQKNFLFSQEGKTDQSYYHCKRVEENLFRLIKECKHLYHTWKETDFFYLSIAACLHDLGKIPTNSEKFKKNDHGEVSCDIINEYFYQLLTKSDIYTVEQIIEYHSKKDKEILEHTDEEIQRLAVLFLLGDVLDTTSERAIKSIEITNEKYDEDAVYKSRQAIIKWEMDSKNLDKINLVATVNNQKDYDLLIKYVNGLNKDLFPAYPFLITYDLPTVLIVDISQHIIQQYKIKTFNPVKLTSILDIENLRTKYKSEDSKKEKMFKEYKFTNLTQNDKMIIDKILENKSPKKILVVGDVMLDHSMDCYPTSFNQCLTHNIDFDYSFCKPGVKPIEDRRLGGAANIAYCCSAFCDVILFGVIGKDFSGDKLVEVAKNSHKEHKDSHFIIPELKEINEFVTTTKIYYHIEDNEKKFKTIRINFELDEDAGKKAILESRNELVHTFRNLLNNEDIECVIFKDHQKGFLSEEFLQEISYYVNARLYNDKDGFFVIVDPKYDWEKFMVFDKIRAITPNIKEASAGVYSLSIKEQNERETAMTNRINNHKLEYEDWIYLCDKYKNISCFIVKADEKGASFLIPKNGNIISVDAYKDKRKENPSEIGCGDLFASYYVQCLMIKNLLGDELSYDNLLSDNLEKIYLYLANAAAGLKLTLEKSKRVMPESVRIALDTSPARY